MPNRPKRSDLMAKIASFPARIARIVENLSVEQLTTHTIPGEWTVAQNVHHLADSHMNAYVRCKLICTEDRPQLKPYDQDRWALFVDGSSADLTASLALLESLHARWSAFWETLAEDDWELIGLHPESGTVTLADQLGYYAAHGDDHIDQIERTLAAGGWSAPG